MDDTYVVVNDYKIVHDYAYSYTISKYEDQILTLHNSCFKNLPNFQSLCGKYGNRAYWILCFEKDQLIGIMTTAYDSIENGWHLYNVCVKTNHRNSQVLTTMYNTLKKVVIIGFIYGYVDKENKLGQLAFTRLGATTEDGVKWSLSL